MSPATLRLPLVALLLGAASTACLGTIEGPSGQAGPQGTGPGGTIGSLGPLPDPATCDATQQGPSPLRRLTSLEYDNTVRDLLGDTTHPGAAFPAEALAYGFDNNADAQLVDDALATTYVFAAEQLAATAVQSSSLLPCNPAQAGEVGCAQQFIATFGQRAFRRPLTSAEATALFGVYQSGRTLKDFTYGVQLVIEAMLQSPQFLYLLEQGQAPASGQAHLTSFETASRLSYFLWGSMPDDALFAAAAADQLQTPDQLTAQAQRMLADPKAHQAVGNFFWQWLELEKLATVTKDATVYPTFSAALLPLMAQETLTFVDDVVFTEGGNLDLLLTAPFTFVNAPLAQYYGLSGVTGPAFVKASQNASQRAGILTQGSILASEGHPDQSDPVHRGELVREQLLCQLLPPPPNGVVITVPPPDATETTRQRFAAHEVGSCASCHLRMDPIGFGFENFDGAGLWRTTDNGQPVDASGVINDIDGQGANVAFTGPVELAQKLSASPQVQACLVLEWFRYANGRAETQADACAISNANAAFTASGGNLLSLVASMTQTHAFSFKTVTP